MEKPAIAGGKAVRKTFLPPFFPAIGKEELAEITDTLRSGWLATGPKAHTFEGMLDDYLREKHTLALSSCTHALHLSLVVAGVGKGDEVITTPFTFISGINVILHQGATPVLVDIERDYYCIDPSKIEQAITKKTKAIIATHYAGQPCAIEDIKKIAKKYRLFLIEDAAHSFGALYKGKQVGTFGDTSCFSFYAAKNLACGEGGAVHTKRTSTAKKLRILSLHGLSRDAWKRYSSQGSWRYQVLYPGYKCNFTDLQASLGIHQLKKFKGFLKKKNTIARLYDRAFASLPSLIVPKVRPKSTHTYYIYPILIDTSKLAISRAAFIEALKAENVGTSVHFIPAHLQPFYKKMFGYKKGDFPVSEWVFDRTISLPIHSAMTMEDAQDVVNATIKVTAFYQKP